MTTTYKYSEEELVAAVAASKSIRAVLLALGMKEAGGSRQNVNRRIAKLELDTSHFTGQGHRKGLTATGKKHWSEHLVFAPDRQSKVRAEVLRRCLIEAGVPLECNYEDCPTRGGWRGDHAIVLEIDHIDGNNLNNEKSNLRFLCPNCHSLEETSSHSWKNTEGYAKKTRCACGAKKRFDSERCIACYQASRKKS